MEKINAQPTPAGVKIAPNGAPMVVIRPKNAPMALRLAQGVKRRARRGQITPEQAQREHADILSKQDYTFAGFLSADSSHIIVSDGITEPLRLGDSFVAANSMAAFVRDATAKPAGWQCAGQCEYSDAWRCARARRLCGRIACDCPCHQYLQLPIGRAR